MPETIYARNGHAVQLQPCPPWCSLTEHLGKDRPIDVDDGFHHEGRQVVVRTSDREGRTGGPETIVKVGISAFTPSLDAEPEQAEVELMLATTAVQFPHTYVKITPGEARAIAAALLSRADLAESGGAEPGQNAVGG